MNRETYHWNTWIRYIPFLNIGWGALRTAYYGYQTFKNWNNDDRKIYSNEVIKSVFGVAAGAAGFSAGGVAGGVFSGLITNGVGNILATLAAEMISGAFLQNLILFFGDIMTTPIHKLRERSFEEWEKLINSDICMKVPIVGSLYSLIRAMFYYYKSNSEEAKISMQNCVIDGIGSIIGLLFGYKLHVIACGPTVNNWCENSNIIDDICRFITFITGKSIKKFEDLLLPSFRSIGKGLGSGAKYLMQKRIQFLQG